MVIYDINGNKILDTILTESAEHEQELGRSDLVRLSWQSDVKITLPAGAYIIPFDDGLKYRLLDNYTPSETDKGFKYEPEFHHPLMLLSRVPFLYDTKDEDKNPIKQQEWSFEGLTTNALEYACKAINEALGITENKFTYTLCGNVDASVSFSVSANDILSVLSSIAQACKDNSCEWHLSWEHRALYFGQISINLGEEVPTLKVHDNIQYASVNESKESYYNCFYPQGSTKNMSRKALVGTGNVATLARLGLDKEKYPDGCIYIDTNGKITTKAKFYASNATKQTLALSFDDVYPHIDLYAYNIRKRVRYLKRDGTNEIEKDSKGNKKTYTIWYMRLAFPSVTKIEGKAIINTTIDDGVTHYWYDYSLDVKKQVLQGYTLKGVFKVNAHATNNQYDALTQPLVGQPNGQDGFELDYHEEDGHNIAPNPADGDSGVSVLKGDYEILKYQSGDIIIPTNESEGIYPRGKTLPDFTCNIVVLFNIVMGEHEIKLAQEELAERTIKEVNRRTQDNNNYSFASNAVAFAKKNPILYIGQKVTFDDGQGYELSTRVIKLITKLDYPIIQEITVGNQAVKGTISQLKEDVNNILSGNFSGAGLNSEQISTIVKNYTNNRFLRKDIPDTAREIITFLKGIALGRNYSIDNDGNAILNLIRSVGIENVGDIITKNLTVTGKMNIFELIIDHIKSAGGALLMTPADGFTIDKVTPVGTDGSELKSTEEIFNLFTVSGKYIGTDEGALGDIRSIQKPIDENSIAGYRLYWKATDGSKARRNIWKVGDQALCKTDNLAEGTTHNAANKEYWCAVTDRNHEGKTVSTEIDGRMYECNYITISTRNKLKNCVVNPAVGDEIVMLGYQGTDDPDRQSAVYLSAHSSLDTGLRAPLLGFYRGINDFDLASHRTSYFDARKGKFVGELEVVTENGPVPIEDYIKDKASVNVETYRLIPSQTVINTGKEETITLSVVHQTGKVVKIVSQSIAHFGILATFYPMAGTPMSRTFSVGEKITSKYLRDNGYLRADLTLQKDIDTPQPIDLDKCTITTVSDGVNGKNGYTLYLSPAHIILDTDSNGLVPPAAISSVSSVVHVLNGNAEVEASEIQAVMVDAEGCKASTDTVEVGGKSYSCIKLVSIDAITDESGTYSNPLSTVDVTVKLKNGTSLVSRMEVTVNLHKVMANFKVQQNKITQRVTSIESDTSQIKSGVADMNTRIAELQVADGQITAEVKAVKGIVGNHTESITKLSVKQGEIDLSIKEASAPRNLLSGTAFRFEKDFEQNNVDHPCHISDTEKYKGTNCLVVDVNETTDVYSGVIFRKIPVTPGKTYTFSFWGKKDGAHVPDAFGSEAKAYKSNGEHADPSRLFDDYVSPSEGWQRFEKTFTATGDVSYIEILVWVIKKGKAYIARPMLEEGDRYTGWTLSVNDDTNIMRGAGININLGRIELNGKTVFKDGNNTEVAVFDNGKIKADLIDAVKVVAEGIQAQEIDAKNATFKNLTVDGDSKFSGTIIAESGKIAGFTIDGKYLTNTIKENEYIGGGGILLRNYTTRVFSLIGNKIIADGTTACYFESSKKNNISNITSCFLAEGAIFENIAINIKGGTVRGFRRQGKSVNASYNITPMDSVILALADNIVLTLPPGYNEQTAPGGCERWQEYTIYTCNHTVRLSAGNELIGYYDPKKKRYVAEGWFDFNEQFTRLSLFYDTPNKIWRLSADYIL